MCSDRHFRLVVVYWYNSILEALTWLSTGTKVLLQGNINTKPVIEDVNLSWIKCCGVRAASVRSSNSLKLITKVYRHSCNAVIPLFPLAIKLRVPANYKMPLDTVLCLDTSASMGFNNNEGINQLKAAARKFLEGVEETARQADLKVRLRIICNTLILHNYIWQRNLLSEQ